MSHLFLAYHQDDQAFASMLRKEIEQRGFAVWQETEPSQPHQCWHTQTDQAIKQAFALILIMTPSARGNDGITYAWAFALGLGVKVITLLHRPTELHPRLTTLGYLDFTDSSRHPWQALIAMLHNIQSNQTSHEASSQAEHPPEPGYPGPGEGRSPTGRLLELDTAAAVQAEQMAVRETLTESLQHPMHDVRIQAALMLAQFQEPQAVPVLIDALRGQNQNIHQHASWGLLHIGAASIPELIKALQDRDPSVRKDSARILGQISDPSAVHALITAITDQDSEVRRATAEALGHIKDQSAVSSLCAALHDEKEHVRRAAAEALGQIGDPTAVDAIIASLEDERESVQVVAAWALGQIQDSAVIPPLLNALRQQNVQLRQAAAEVLKEIDDPSLDTALNEALLDHDLEVRRTAARVLGHIRGRQRLSQRDS